MTPDFRCINEACRRGFPRAVRFCPYCGTAQAAAAPRAAVPPPAPVPPPASPPTLPPTPPVAPIPPRTPAAAPTPSPAAPARPPAAPRPEPAQPPRYQQPQPAAGVPRPPGGVPGGPSQPPLRKPIGKGTWLFVALLLLAIWFLVKPGDPAKKLDRKVDDAVALTESCKIGDAREALAELRREKASATQLARLQKAISATAPACEKKSQRAKAWSDTRAALETALAANALDKASTRLSAFVKRWGEDEPAREMRSRIDARRAEKLLDDASACLDRRDRACVEAKLNAAEKLRRPETRQRIDSLREALSRMLEATLLEGAQVAPGQARPGQGRPAGQGAYPPPLSTAPPQPATSPLVATAARTASGSAEARRLQGEAERELAQGNYRSAIGLAGQCTAAGGAECGALRDRAARLERELHACVQGGREWVGQRCE
ncbi:hypothetical protein [Pseudoduganella albidiflava]|uniref:DUF1311 domain-containing protein n=2 Tax=Pseudoduganella albidiflava TaxID=321983 RepID=A0ABX5RN90_9BURK|nr:hypothetical protein [Pseudoduganella albidiflava]QBI00029.1 hypothetical protein EYF70_03585 [Pseudoduganella albidiflava]